MIGLVKEFFTPIEEQETGSTVAGIGATTNSGSYADYSQIAVPKGSVPKVANETGSATLNTKEGKGPHFASALAPKKLDLNFGTKPGNPGVETGSGPDGIPKESPAR